MAKFQLVEARPSHIKELTKFCMVALREGHEKNFPLSRVKIQAAVTECVTSAHQLAVIALVDGKIRGVILGHVAPHAYADGLIASDLALYVAPSLRGSSCFTDLAEVFDHWCDQIPNLLGRVLSVSRINATTPVIEAHYCNKMGYKKGGVDFVKLGEQYQ